MRKSMNRVTVIIILTVFLCLSVGYALFSDTITIEGTATAQGNFDIEASCITNITPDLIYSLGIEDDVNKDGSVTPVSELFKEHGYKDVSCTINNDTVNFSVGFDYPGAAKWYIVKMKNSSSVAATLDFWGWYEEYGNSLSNTIKKYDKDGNLIETIESSELPGDYDNKIFFWWYESYTTIEDINGNFYNLEEDEFESFFVDDKLKLEPNESLYFFVYSTWPEGKYVNDNNIKYVVTESFEFDWQQYIN